MTSPLYDCCFMLVEFKKIALNLEFHKLCERITNYKLFQEIISFFFFCLPISVEHDLTKKTLLGELVVLSFQMLLVQNIHLQNGRQPKKSKKIFSRHRIVASKPIRHTYGLYVEPYLLDSRKRFHMEDQGVDLWH